LTGNDKNNGQEDGTNLGVFQQREEVADVEPRLDLERGQDDKLQ
jgi:hypothetical protein